MTTNGSGPLHQCYIYHDYLQIATCDPTQTIATRPLAIRKDGTWYAYGWDLTKNICEVYGRHGYIRTAYTYTPYGQVSSTGDVEQPILWSSEYHDTELALVYYNYRHYNPTNGRWTGRDLLEENDEHNLYTVVRNATIYRVDRHGLFGFNYMRFETALYEANARLTTNAIRAISELLEGYSAMRDANIIGINCAKESSCECC